ncbi:hypothetical protein [Desnuesiella massiliensis]|uniref:hypothetical protein n=1 Tax=Desnuesiella massiliensis TaxID=1650662 RepID=UPI0006E37EA2|nr:hypothetical protein [Desnuesiella massiliensis]
MKYFTLELLDKASNMSNSEYEIFDELWKKNLTDYWNQFKNYQDRLPSRFIKEYYKHAFHDYNIESIMFYKEGKKKRNCLSVELKLSLDDIKYLIKYTGVTKYSLNVSVINDIHDNTFLYSEILPVDNTKMSHEILFVDRNTIFIEFKKLIFRKIIF